MLKFEIIDNHLQEIRKSLASKDNVVILENLKELRNLCAEGQDIQDAIATKWDTFPIILDVFSYCEPLLASNHPIEVMCYQFIANLVVKNLKTKKIVWHALQEHLTCLNRDSSVITDIQLMILYNILKGKNTPFDAAKALKICAQVWQNVIDERNLNDLVYLHLMFEHLLIDFHCTQDIYNLLSTKEKISVLHYIKKYVTAKSPNGWMETAFFEFLSHEFKTKSDCILNTITSDIDKIYPLEVYAILKVIAAASGDDEYAHIFRHDHSLFLNMGAFLQSITSIGKQSRNIFTPMRKLEEVAPNSTISCDYETEISFELKSLLVRTLANMLYRNKKNQEYAREMGIITAILDCSTIDARNPCIQEWSILAIKNFCENCPKNQEIIKELAPKNLVNFLDMEGTSKNTTK